MKDDNPSKWENIGCALIVWAVVFGIVAVTAINAWKATR